MSQTTRLPGCLPWCDEHIAGSPDPLDIEDQLCLRRIPVVGGGEVLVTHRSDEGTLLEICGFEGEFTPTRAKSLMDALAAAPQSELVAAGRSEGAL